MVHACRRPVSAFQGPRSPRSHWPSLIDLCTSLCYIDIQIGATNQVELTICEQIGIVLQISNRFPTINEHI